MPKSRAPLTLLAATLFSGCASLDPAVKLGLENAISASDYDQHGAVQAVAAKPAETPPPITPVGPPPELSEADAMLEIAPALGALATADPGLHAEVLEQLSGTKPHLWSLTVQRAEHTLAYRQQLASHEAPQETPAVAAPPSRLPSPVAPPVVQASATLPVTQPPLPTVVGNPTTPQPVTTNPYYRVASAVTPTVEPLVEPPVEPAPEPLPWREHLTQAIERFQETEGTEPRSPEKAREHIRLRLLQLAAGQSNEAAVAPPGLEPTEQGYWSNQLWAINTLLQGEGDDLQAKFDATGRHQTQASTKLGELSTLQVNHFSACEAIYGYGAYKPLDEAVYRPGQTMSLYAEIKNYRSKLTDEGYHTLISSSCRLLDSSGNVAMVREIPAVDDLCLTRRRDFHLKVGILLPTGLPEGDYRLELTVTDRLSNKTGLGELPITIER